MAVDRDLSFLYDRIDRAIGDVINFDAEYKETVGSVANAYIIEKVNPNGFSPLPLSTTAYTKHLKVSFRVEHPCTGAAATLKVNSITATPYPAIKTKDGNNPAPSDMPLNSIVDLIYDGTVAPGNFVIERTTLISANNVVYVNSIDDLPEESGGKRILAAYTVYDFQSIPITLNDAEIHFEEGARIINGLITTNQSFHFTEDGSAREIRDTKITYTGTGTGTEAFFNSDGGDSGNSIIRLLRVSIHCQHTSGTMRFFKLASSDPTGIVILDQVAMLHETPGTASLVGGSFTGLGVLIRNCRLYHYDDGFQFSNNLPGFIISKLEAAFGLNAADSVIVDVSGTQGTITIQGVGTKPQANERVFYFDPSIDWATAAGSLNVALCPISLASGGQVFKTGSSDQTNINASFVGNTNIADSTIKARLSITNNTGETDIAANDTLTPIFNDNSSETYTFFQDGSIEERMVFQDRCTFSDSTDFVSSVSDEGTPSAFDHGLNNGDEVKFYTFNGTLPTNISATTTYFVINKTANTFQISLTEGGAAVDFGSDGSGVLYYRHVTGNSLLGCVIYTGLEAIAVKISGWVSAKRTAAETNLINFSTYIMKSDTAGTVTSHTAGGVSRISNTVTTASVLETVMSLSTNEGVLIYIQTKTGATGDLDLIASDAVITMTKV